MKYDYLIVGSGLWGSVFAHEAKKRNKSCLVVEKLSHIGGHIYTLKRDDIDIHMYGAHIFHTSSREIWDYIRGFSDFNHYINAPIANYKGEIYNLPFNMNTFHAMWGAVTPEQAKKKIEEQCAEIKNEPANLEEQAISLVGRDVYQKLVKGYTEKQWGRSCRNLPAFIIKRLPVRYVYNNNYFNDFYQGIPVNGYTAIIEKMLEGCDVWLDFDYNSRREQISGIADKTIYTGSLDAYFDHCYGHLEYRTLRFETKRFEMENYQGVAVINYTDRETPFTRVIEHKHFMFGTQPVTYVSWEYPEEWKPGRNPYYPVNDEKNQRLFLQYQKLAHKQKKVIFGGRQAEYRYYNMDQTIASALSAVKKELEA